MLIYSENISSRLEYAAEVFFKPWYPNATVTADLGESARYDGPVICYHHEKVIPHSIWIKPNGLLFETNHSVQDPVISVWKGMPTFFPMASDIPFDVLAATFYLVSRYEEYNKEDGRDEMGRFVASASFAFRNNFLDRPLIDEWRQVISEIIEEKWTASSQLSEYKEFVSIDVDSAFAYKHKGFKRTIGGFGLDILNFRFGNFVRRVSTLIGLRADDFDTYDQILAHQKSRGIQVIWFFLLADYNKHDINVPHTSDPLRKLIAKLDGKGQVGIHPGVKSNGDITCLKKEINRLVEITRRPCLHSRQHYLVMRFPETYRNLYSAGIRHDYTMGYADQPGFRASTSYEFRWYDLSKEEVTNLYVHPFSYMDITYRHYLNLSSAETESRIVELKEKVQKTRGVFISLWHNESFSNLGKWKNWKPEM